MSGAGSFQTDVATMQVASGHVYEVNEQVQAQLRDLLHRLDPLLGTWQGAAATSFHALTERWHQNATQLNAALRGIGDGLVQSQRNYASSEDANQQGFTGVAGHLG
jgi:WXG100 family type VII secretion target